MAKSIFEILINLPPPDDPRWDKVRLDLEKQRRAMRRKQLAMDKRQRRTELRGARLAAVTLARIAGDPAGLIGPPGQSPYEQALAVMRPGDWYRPADLARLTGTWRGWAQAALRWALMSGLVESHKDGFGPGRGRGCWPYRLTDAGEAWRACRVPLKALAGLPQKGEGLDQLQAFVVSDDSATGSLGQIVTGPAFDAQDHANGEQHDVVDERKSEQQQSPGDRQGVQEQRQDDEENDEAGSGHLGSGLGRRTNSRQETSRAQ